jgi:hypothetical protein
MKRLNRDNPGIDQIKLLSTFARNNKIAQYSEEALKAFGDEASRSVATIVEHDSRLSGLRAESVFLAVVTGIGKVQLIKAEDDGELYYAGADVRIPDYRIVLGDGSSLLVEVKALSMDSIEDKFKLSDSAMQQLRRYAELMKTELRFAIFWDRLNVWTLNRLEAFESGVHGEKQWSIDFPRAFGTSEMAVLGDKFIATPAPLVFRVHVDPNGSDPHPEGEGSMRIKIARAELLSRDKPLSGRAAQIAWTLLWHGSWEDAGQRSELEGNRLLWIDHLIAPTAELDDWSDPEDWREGCQMIGSLSRIITSAYLSGAKQTVHTTSKSQVLAPGFMGQFIPDDFMTLGLPLALMTLESNLESKESDAG